MTKYKPQLAIDATDHLDTIKYPKYASYKLDGIRAIFHPELGLVSRSLKPIQNKQLNEKFANIIKRSKELNIIFDGEFYNHDLSFQEITALVMTQDFLDEKTLKKLSKNKSDLVEYYDSAEIFNNPLEFHCFDAHKESIDTTFHIRLQIVNGEHWWFNCVKQEMVNSKEEVKALFAKALEEGYEGLILRDPSAPYKYGRSTLKEEFCLKVKPFETFDAQVIGIEQATEVNEDVEKTTNELGRSVTSKKKGDRHAIEKASAFFVKYGDHQLKVSLAMTDEEKESVWNNRNRYVGKWIEYKGMVIGAKDVPRHPVFVRFREDKQ